MCLSVGSYMEIVLSAVARVSAIDEHSIDTTLPTSQCVHSPCGVPPPRGQRPAE